MVMRVTRTLRAHRQQRKVVSFYDLPSCDDAATDVSYFFILLRVVLYSILVMFFWVMFFYQTPPTSCVMHVHDAISVVIRDAGGLLSDGR